MTPKEAIEYLNIMKLSTEDDSVGEIKKEVCDMAIEALEKQIPKKATMSFETGMNECPSCEMPFFFDENPSYCSACGQHLDWGEEE